MERTQPFVRKPKPSENFGVDLIPKTDPARVVDLREFGFVGRVSDEALAEIRRIEARQARALTMAHLYVFGEVKP